MSVGSISIVFNTPILTKFFVQDETNAIVQPLNTIMTKAAVKISGNAMTASLANGYIGFDAVTRQQHSFSNVVTQHPVESGSKITDHVQNQPQPVSLDVIFSNSPVTLLGNVGAAAGMQGVSQGMTTFQGGIEPLVGLMSTATKQMGLALRAYNVLYAVWKAKSLLTVLTSWQVYRNMMITNVSAPRETSTGGKIQCSIDLMEVVIVDTMKISTDLLLQPTIDLGSAMPLFPDPVMIAQAAVFLALLVTAQVQGGI